MKLPRIGGSRKLFVVARVRAFLMKSQKTKERANMRYYKRNARVIEFISKSTGGATCLSVFCMRLARSSFSIRHSIVRRSSVRLFRSSTPSGGPGSSFSRGFLRRRNTCRGLRCRCGRRPASWTETLFRSDSRRIRVRTGRPRR